MTDLERILPAMNLQVACAAILNMTDGFGKYLREYRAMLGLTQTQLAGQLGITQVHLSNLETGESKPSLEMVRWVYAHVKSTTEAKSHG